MDPRRVRLHVTRCLGSGALAAAVAMLACSSSTTEVQQGPDHLAVSPGFVSLPPGGTQQLTTVVYDAADSILTGATVTYQSSDTTVAKVTPGGNVTAVATGTALIQVNSRPASTTVQVGVSQAATLLLVPDSSFLTGSQTYQLAAIVRDSAGNVLPGAPVIWVSLDTTSVHVSTTGVLSRGGTGSAYVIAASGAARDSALVTALVARVPVGVRAFATAIRSPGAGYVTLPDAGAVQPLAIATPGASGAAITVGALPTSIALNGAGTLAYVGNQDGGSITVINTATNTATGTIVVGSAVLSLLVPPGDSLLLVGTNEGHVFIVRLSSGAVVDSFPALVTNALAMRGDTTVFANALTSASVVEYNLRTRQVVRALPVGGVPQGMVVAPGGTTLYLANETGHLQFWDLASGTLADSVALPPAGGFGLARNPANGLLYVSTSYYGSRVLVVDPVAKQVVRTIVTGGVPRRITFTSNGSVGIVANENGWVDYIQ